MTTNTSASVANAALAQTFLVTVPAGLSGMYVPSIDLFFSSVSSSFGVELSIVNLTNGLPDVTLPVAGAQVSLDAGYTVASTNGSVATNFPFPRLVFLQSGTQYALIVRGLGATPDYQLWTALAGDTDIVSGVKIANVPGNGTLYYAKSSSSWAAITGEDLKYAIYRCQFNYNATSYAGLTKTVTEIISMASTQYASGFIDIQPGDELWGLVKDGSGNITANTSVHAKVGHFDYQNELIYCHTSTGNLSPNTFFQVVRAPIEGKITGVEQLLATATIADIKSVAADGIVAKIGSPSDSSVGISFSYRGTVKQANGAYTLEPNFNAIPIQVEKEFTDATRYFLSRSDEIAYLAGNSSIHIRAGMTSNTDFISPMLDLKEHSVIGYGNQVNNNISGEQGDLGNSLTRYISKTVTLAEGMDAETLTVWIDAYKPATTEVYIYAKIWNSEDPNTFDSNPWTRMVQTSNLGVYSDSNNVEDYVEFEYQFPNAIYANTDPNYSSVMAWQPSYAGVAQTVQYQSNTGTYYGFKSFAVKAVLAVDGTDTFEYPRLTDVRAIALLL